VKNRIPHIAPLLYLLLLLLPFVSLLLLQGAQYYLEGTAEERLAHYQLVTVTLPADKIIWHKKGKELNINGKLFDVKASRLSNGTLTATGFYDEDEISLVYLLTALTSPENSRALLHFLLVLQCFAIPLLFFAFRGLGAKRITHHTLFSFSLPRPFYPMEEQPPPC
jgi:hypothetical protein